ncbi:MAG TPA: MarR family winged helix-turn-helix transcriptional regulator [Longimicrobium sp.]|nr:MarR family winged helix-turn-helix transcriptional regulator [Longimicrobium sp.]
MSGRTPAGDALTQLVMRTFRLNGLFLDVAETIARPSGLTAARWQVLGAVLRQPITVSGVARAMGLTRQSVQRLADALVDDGMAAYLPNPAHRRARLLAPTGRGWEAIGITRPRQHAWTRQVTEEIGAEEIERAVRLIDRVVAKLEDDPWRPG